MEGRRGGRGGGGGGGGGREREKAQTGVRGIVILGGGLEDIKIVFN